MATSRPAGRSPAHRRAACRGVRVGETRSCRASDRLGDALRPSLCELARKIPFIGNIGAGEAGRERTRRRGRPLARQRNAHRTRPRSAVRGVPDASARTRGAQQAHPRTAQTSGRHTDAGDERAPCVPPPPHPPPPSRRVHPAERTGRPPIARRALPATQSATGGPARLRPLAGRPREPAHPPRGRQPSLGCVFGTGIVATLDDFGMQGQLPSHPELLDHLALYLVDNGWSIKALHRHIVTSDTYQRSSVVTEELVANQESAPATGPLPAPASRGRNHPRFRTRCCRCAKQQDVRRTRKATATRWCDGVRVWQTEVERQFR